MKLGYLFSINILFHMKGHVRNLFYHKDMIYIFPSNYKIPSVFNYINKQNTLYYDSDNAEMLYSILKDFDMLFVTEHFSLDFYNLKKYKEILKDISIYFIAHGTTGFYELNENTLKLTRKKVSPFNGWANFILQNKNTYFITCCNFIQKHLLNLTNNKTDQIIKVNHLPQFSLNDILYNNVTSKSKLDYLHNSVVIFPVYHDKENIEIIKLIVMNLIGDNKNIIIKIKPKVNYKPDTLVAISMQKWQNDLKPSLKKYNDININITTDSNNAQYFHCDKVITLKGGTSFFEALTYNNKTFNIEFEDRWEYQHLPISFNKLLICNNINEFKTKLELIKNEKYFDNNYEKEKERLFAFQIGSNIKKKNINDWNAMINNKILCKLYKYEKEFEIKWNNNQF